MAKRVLVIGAGGLLGNRIIEIGSKHYQMFGTYNSHEIAAENFLKLDVTKSRDVLRLMDKLKPEWVIDTHSLTNLDYCEVHQEEAWLVNVEGVKNVAEACNKTNSKMVFLSSDGVFDGKKDGKYNEEDNVNPLNYYAKTKAIAENVVEILNYNSIIIRTTVLYGKDGISRKSFASFIINNLKKMEKVNVVTDQYNNPTFTDNLAEIILDLCEKDVRGTFHVFGPDFINRYEFALKIAEAFDLPKNLINPITTEELKQIGKRPEKLDMDTSKVRSTSDIRLISLKEGLSILKNQIG